MERIYKYFDEVNAAPVVYHWKYMLEEIDPREEIQVKTLPLKKSSQLLTLILVIDNSDKGNGNTH